jgi:endonuclease/exonuclease/phosphatase family metal-dependent hydrolase
VARFVRLFVGVGAIVALLVAMLPVESTARSANPVVMTRNLYLGADLTSLISAQSPGELVVAAGVTWLAVAATDFPERAKLIAQEIDDTSPDVIGLQEVALWRFGAFPDPADATDVEYDFLEILQAELVELGLTYSVAVVQETFDAEAPALVPTDGTPVMMDIRLTQRNVILVRDGVSYTNPQSEYYDTNMTYPDIGGIAGNDLVDLRGWVSVDIAMAPKEKPFRFVNTHLESFVPPVRTAQAQELVDGPLSGTLKVIAVGDFNSPPTGPLSGAYQILTDPSNGKMRDAWTEANGADPGFTFGQAADLTNASDESSTRIDHVLTSTAAVKTVSAQLVGTTAPTTGGLWASDHFGVVAELSMP